MYIIRDEIKITTVRHFTDTPEFRMKFLKAEEKTY